MLNKVSTWQVGKWLDELAEGPSYAALTFAEPQEADPLSVEVTGSGYRRQRVYWRRRGRALLNRLGLDWRGLDTPQGLVAVVIFDAENRGNVRASGLLPEPITLYDVGGFTLGAGELSIYID